MRATVLPLLVVLLGTWPVTAGPLTSLKTPSRTSANGGATEKSVELLADFHTEDQDFRCFDLDFGKVKGGLPFLEMPDRLSGDPMRKQICCAHVDLEEVDKGETRPKIAYMLTTNSTARKDIDFMKDRTGFCRVNSKQFQCCCTESYCNSQNFIAHHFNEFRKENYGSFFYVHFVFLFVALIVIGAVLGFAYGLSRYFCLQKYTREGMTEVRPIKNVDMRGIVVEPYLTPLEVEATLKNIRTSRSLNVPPPANVKKFFLRSVTTFSTIDDLTLREPAPAELPPLTSANPCMELLQHMIRIGPREIKFQPETLLMVYERALAVMKKEPVLVETSLPVQIYGDLHGQYSDLIRWFRINGWPPMTRCVFMGDYVDRGRHCLEVITLLLCLKAVMPYDVIINRGNHEDATISRTYSFYAECINRLPKNANLNQRVFDKLAEVFAWMPLATKLNGKILCLHGGLSPKLESWDSIAEIKRPMMNLLPNTLACDLTWSDPDKKTDDYLVNYKRDKKNGIGFMFGYKQVDTVCKSLDIQLILRGHQAPMNGYELFGPHMITVFSAPGYRGVEEEANFGASLHIDERGRIDVTRVGVSSVVRKERNRQKLDKGDGYLDWAEIKDRPLEDDEERSC